MFIKNAFRTKDLRHSMLAATPKNDKKDYLVALIKSIGIIQELIDKNLYFSLYNKNVVEI